MQTLNNLTFDDNAQPADVVVVEAPTQIANMTELVWNYVRDNPGATAGEVKRGLGGHIDVSTRLVQLRHRGYIKTDMSGFPHRHSVDNPFVSTHEDRTERLLAARKKWLAENKKKKKAKQLAKVKEQSAPAPAPKANVDLQFMSVLEARKLYDELKQIFGG